MAKLVMMMAVLVVLATTSLITTEAQTSTSCASELVPCYSYINTTGTPPASCCNPINETVTTQLACLCTLYNTPGLLQSFGITVQQALNLTERCHISTDINACNASAPSPTSSHVPPPPGVAGNDGGISASRMAWTGVLSLLLFWASIILY